MSTQSPSSIHANDASEVTCPAPVKLDDDKVYSLFASRAVKERSDILQISKNPYRQAIAISAPALSRSVSQETPVIQSRSLETSANCVSRSTYCTLVDYVRIGKKQTARSRQTPTPYPKRLKKKIPFCFRSLNHRRGRNPNHHLSFHELPLLPPFRLHLFSIDLTNAHSASDSCLVVEDDNFVSSQKTKQTQDKNKQPQYPLQSSSVYPTSAGAAPSSSLLPTDSRPSKHKCESYGIAIPFPDLGSTPARQEAKHPLPGQSSKATRAVSNTASSLPDGSTVGNIYKHYVRSEIFDDIDSVDDDVHSECDMADGDQRFGKRAIGDGLSSDFLSNDQLQQSALEPPEAAPS